MLLIGRITKDAVVATLKDERSVVNFSIAINDYYKPKNGEAKTFTEYVSCSYWISTKIAAALTKGTLIEITGRIYVQAYKDMNGDARASFNCHVNNINILAKGTKATVTVVTQAPEKTEVLDDLPF